MEQSKLKSATEATAKALDKPTESINQQNTSDAITQLRLANLKKTSATSSTNLEGNPKSYQQKPNR